MTKQEWQTLAALLARAQRALPMGSELWRCYGAMDTAREVARRGAGR